MNIRQFFTQLFGGSTAIRDTVGVQQPYPSRQVFDGLRNFDPELALQAGTVYACVNLIAETIASLPFVVYENVDGMRKQARNTGLWYILHDQPNKHMTAFEFWRAMVFFLQLRGNAYARIVRKTDSKGTQGSATALVIMPPDQVRVAQDESGNLFYEYTRNSKKETYSSLDVLHIKGLGNGIVGMSKLEYMGATVNEALNAQETATNLYKNGNKPAGVLSCDHILSEEQRTNLKKSFATMAQGQPNSLFILEAAMKYSPISMTPADTELLATRKFSTAEICRWFGVPPVLIGSEGTTTWGSGIEQIISGFHTFTIRPLLVLIEQAVRTRVLTSLENINYTVEFNFDALLRSSESARYEIYAKGVQNGLLTRNEARKLENRDPIDGGDELTVQSNLIKLGDLGKITPTQTSNAQQQTAQGTIKQ